MKEGTITHQDKQDARSIAERVLENVKRNKKEKRKVPVRIDNKTILLVSPKKAKELKKMIQL